MPSPFLKFWILSFSIALQSKRRLKNILKKEKHRVHFRILPFLTQPPFSPGMVGKEYDMRRHFLSSPFLSPWSPFSFFLFAILSFLSGALKYVYVNWNFKSATNRSQSKSVYVLPLLLLTITVMDSKILVHVYLSVCQFQYC